MVGAARNGQIKFSIVITTYNRFSLLKRAIDSALGQTVPCEVVVVDDCSSDDTEIYVRSLGDRIVYHRNSVNMGHSASINAGVEVATGDWIKPVDDDDYLAPNCIEQLTKAIALRPEAVICSCQAAQVDVNQVEIRRTIKTGPGQVFYIPQEDIHYGMLMEQIPFGTPIQVGFRRDAFLKSGGWDSQLDVNFDDIDSWIRISQFGDAIFINECLAYRTVWPGSYNQNFCVQKRLNTHISIKNKIYNLVSEKYLPNTPSREAIRDYLKLHWGLVAAKNKQFLLCLKLAFPAVLSTAGWKLLGTAILTRKFDGLFLPNHTDDSVWTMTKLYPLVSEKQSDLQPKFNHIRAYLQLHKSWLACKEGKILKTIRLAFPSAFSIQAWQILLTEILSEKVKSNKPLIRQIVLRD